MQPPRVFVFTGLSSCLIHLLLILLLFAGSLSTVPTAAVADESLSNNATSFPLVFPEGEARPYANATAVLKEMLDRSIRNESESYDLQHGSVSKAEAAVDSEDGDTSLQNSSAPATNTSTDDTTQALTTTSSMTNIVTSSTTSETTSPSSTTSTTTTTTTTMIAPITHETVTQTVTQTTMPTTASQTDATESVTAETLTEDSGGMPTGIVALVTMITFAIVVGYVSLIVWRRYLEYRYGNRELLVNDLEFDTNDLRHFEL